MMKRIGEQATDASSMWPRLLMIGTAIAAALTFVVHPAQAHAGPMGYGTDDDEAYAMAACVNLSGMVGDSPSKAEQILLNGNSHGGHITLAQAHAIVRDQVAAGCQNVGR